MLELEVSLDGCELGIYEILLARETGTILVFVVGLCRGRPDELDGCAQLHKMRVGDEVLFYHSGEEKAVVGIAKVRRTAYPDPTAKEGDWSTLDLAPIKPLRRPVALRDIKSNLQLKRIPLVRQSRLSVMPLDEPAFREIIKMAAT